MASSSSSHQRNQESSGLFAVEHAVKRRRVSESSTLYDVFINHRGPDCKGTLAIQLYNSFVQLSIKAFHDSEEKTLGNSFLSTIETAIRSAKVHIAIFSETYAESPWCLEELLHMVESTAKIIPVFYKVKPSDLRYIKEGKGAYAKAFSEHKKKGRYPEEKLNAWTDALQSLSLVAGEEFSEGDCQSIVAAALKEVQANTILDVAEHPVGLNNLVEDFEKLCLNKLVQDFENQFGQEEGKHKARVAPIFGMGGVGKTTLAKEFFNKKKSNYSRTSFLFDVREAHATRILPSLQCKLLKDLFNEERSFTSIEEGKSYLKDRLRRAPLLRALIVVDDIDHVDQLDALVVMDISKQSNNNLVIVTTRDAGVLISAGITDGYNLKGMNSNYATKLFCWHAFRQDHPRVGYEMLVKDFVVVCGGLPLSLQILGRHVRGRAHKYWSLELDKVRKTLPRDVKQRLRISFDALDDDEKQVFMDVACFFLGKPKRMAERVCEGSGWSGQHALETLKERCLVEEKENFSILYNQTEIVLKMHDHLRDLGREMARELSSPCRLWHPQDLKSLEFMGLKTILAKTNTRCFLTIFDESIGCQVTFFLGHSDFCVETSASLLWLQLEGNSIELPSIPPWFPLQKLHCLQIKSGRFKTLWENQAPSHLKELLIFQTSLKEIPEMLGISDSLENVFLDAQNWPIQGLSLIESLSMNLSSICLVFSRLEGEEVSVKRARTFSKSLIIVNFKFNGKVDWNNGGISASVEAPASALEKLEICYEKFLSRILICGIHYPKLKSIKLCAIDNLTEVNLTGMKTLNCLAITRCLKIQSIIIDSLSCMENIEVDTCEKLQSITLPTTLFALSIRNCRNLQRVSGTSDLMELKKLTIRSCPELEELASLSKVSCMENIEVDTCEKLQSITLPTTLFALFIRNCRNLQRVSGTSDLMELKKLTIRSCPELEELPSLSKVSCMENIEVAFCKRLQSITLPTTLFALSIRNCRNLQRVSGTSDLMELKELTIRSCPELEELASLSKVSCMKNIEVDTCEKLQSITLPRTLFCLCVINCTDLQKVAATGDLLELKKLTIRKCPELKELPSLARPSLLEHIMIDYCEKLEKIAVTEELQALKLLTLCYCSNATIRSCIHKLKNPPSYGMIMMGKAVDAAESILNEGVFSEAQIGAVSVTDVTRYSADVPIDNAAIDCYLVVVDSSTWIDDVSNICKVERKLIFTFVHDYYKDVLEFMFEYLGSFGRIKKGFRAETKKWEEWKIVDVLRTIVDRLHYL